MLHTLDISAQLALSTRNNINNEPAIVKYWITDKLSPAIKEKNIKIIINDNIQKNPKK